MSKIILLIYLICLFKFPFSKVNNSRSFYCSHLCDLKRNKKGFLFSKWKSIKCKNGNYFKINYSDKTLKIIFSPKKVQTDVRKINEFSLSSTYLHCWVSPLFGKLALTENLTRKRHNRKKITLLANWKCYLKKEEAYHLIDALTKLHISDEIELILSPNLLYIPYLKKKIEETNSKIKICSQDISVVNGSGPFTGETTANILSDFLGSDKKKYTLIGHSERKKGFLKNPETDEQTTAKIYNAIHADFDVVLCIGNDFLNSKCEYSFSKIADLLSLIKKKITYDQWKRMMFAFEPSFAVGTGIPASCELLNDCYSFVKRWLAEEINQQISDHSSILYGGSIGKSNIKSYLHNTLVDGFLIGKASVSESFIDIINILKNIH